MNRYRQYGQLDDQPEVVGDGSFQLLDMLTDPAMLDAGKLAISENLRFDANGTTVRGGMARQFPAGETLPVIYGVAVFKPSADDNYLAFVTANYLALYNLATQEFSYYNYPGTETVEATDKVDLVQAGIGAGSLPDLYILRGQSKSVLKYSEGDGTLTIAASFEPGDFALFYQDRIAVAANQDVHVSDFLDFTAFSLLNQFQITKGGNEYLRAFLSYQKDYVLIGTNLGWFIAYFDPTIGTGGYDGSLKDTSFIRVLTREAGPVGKASAIEAMGLLWFITGGAIYAFQPQLDNQLTVLGKPISADIQPIMDRMCVRYADRACVERYGYRLYFALPISELPLAITSVSIVESLTVGLTLPFTLPTSLSTTAVVTFTTAEDHQLADGAKIELSGSMARGLNGEFTVLSVPDQNTFIVGANVAADANVGDRMKVQKLATRNNVMAVFNLNNKGWESIDWLPTGLFADWLRPVEVQAQRRLMVIDQDAGPFLYEENAADDLSDAVGGIQLPVTLPFVLSSANYVTAPVVGRLRTRAYRWGIYPRKITKAEVRSTLDSDSTVTLNLLARTPNNRLWSGTRTYLGADFDISDVPLRKLCGERALEAQVEITTAGGRPTFRSISVETMVVGKTPE